MFMCYFFNTIKWEIFVSSNFRGKSQTTKIEILETFSKFDQLFIYLFTEQ